MDDAIAALALDPTGRWLVTGGEGGIVQVWDLSDPAALKSTTRRVRDRITAVAISPDGRRLLVGGNDGIWSWHLEDFAVAEPVSIAKIKVNGLAFSPDRRWLIAGCDDGTIRSWHAPSEELIELAGRVAGRNLTRDEWSRFFPIDQPYQRTFPDRPGPTGGN